MKTKVGLLILISIILISCETTNSSNVPSWFINQYDATYTKTDYICAVGSGSTKEEAQENASVTISQIFNTSIKNALVTFDNDTTSSMSSRGYIDTSVDDLMGLKVVNTYVNNEGTFFVRVALDKKIAINKIREKITPTNNEITSLMQLKESDFEYLQDLLRARKLAMSIQSYFDQLSVLEQSTVTSPLLSIEKKITALKQELSLSLNVESENSFAREQLQKAVETMLLDNGISINEGKAILTLDYNSSNAPPKDGLYQCNFTLKVQVIENSVVVISYDKNGKAIGISDSNAQEKAIEKVVEIIQGELL